MEYQLSLWQTLAANFSADNMALSIIVVVSQLIVPLIMFMALRNYPRIRSVILAILIATTVGFSVFPIYGNGWKIVDKQLHMNAYGVSDTINIEVMRIGIVKVGDQWDPIRRDMGAGLPNLLVGRCTMDNGKKALVFYYRNPDEMLLIEAKHKYYIIAYPGMESLYSELVRLGAKETLFG